ncbi:hypothetical protein D3C86_1366150 [compost metagenome]
MDSTDVPEPADDFVERVLIRWGLLGVVIGLAAACAAILYISHRISAFIFPGA